MALFSHTLVLLLLSLQTCFCQPSLSLPASPSSVAVNRENGEVFIAAASQLLRLSSMLEPLDNVTVSGGGEFVLLALSPDGSTLVGCLGGDSRTCLVYNSEDLSSGPSATVDNAHYSSENGLAIIAMNDSFYLGSEGAFAGGGNDNIYLAQYSYTSDTVRTTGGERYIVDRADFVRYFYGGIARNGYVYYFVADQDPSSVRVLRVCDCARTTCSSQFEALYEQVLQCIGSAATTRVCGVHLLESFAGLAGPLVVVTQCDSGTRNRACAFLLSDIDGDMDAFYDECRDGTNSNAGAPWDFARQCSEFNVSVILILL